MKISGSREFVQIKKDDDIYANSSISIFFFFVVIIIIYTKQWGSTYLFSLCGFLVKSFKLEVNLFLWELFCVHFSHIPITVSQPSQFLVFKGMATSFLKLFSQLFGNFALIVIFVIDSKYSLCSKNLSTSPNPL